MRLDLSWVDLDLAVGGRIPVGAAEQVSRALGIKRIVDVRLEEKDDEEEFGKAGIKLLHLPTLDRCAVERQQLWTGVLWVGEETRKGHKVLIHCEHGIGRSALLTCCVLVSRGMAPIEALQRARAARPRVCPSPKQLYALLGWSAEWHARACTPQPRESWADLAAIVYGSR